MDIVLLVVALALTGAAAGIWMWLRTRRIAADLHRRNTGLEREVAEQTAALRRALSAVDADSRRLVEDNRAKDELLRAIGRELRTPLTTVMGFCQWLQANPDADPLTHRQAEALRQIEAAGGVLWALVEEADDVVAAHEAVCRLSVQRIDMRLALRQACDGLEPQARAAGVVLACPPPASGLGVTGDAAQVRHILRRLMLNAIRHTSAGGTVRLALDRIDDRVVTTIVDPDCATDDPVDRLARSLGVATAKLLAERLGGEITTSVGADGEAVFTLSLPAAGAAPVERRQGAVILYIEDNLANIALLRQVAAGLGLTLYSATSGPEGLELARSLRPDLVLLDIGLPGMDGYEVRAHLGLDPVTRDIPVMALTAAASPCDIRKGQAAGFDAYLTKPLDLPALTTALDNALRSAPAAASGMSAA